MFTDRIKVKFIAGKGGNGIVAWNRFKYIPKGGPCGGDGGKGGSITLQADAQIYCLDGFRNNRQIKAPSGVQGGPNCQSGGKGENLLIKVPCGTLIKDAVTGERLYDLTVDGQEWVICRGGKGGYGNERFKTSINRSPSEATPGEEGEVRVVEMELKLIADIGLVGFPNAGKSTILSSLTEAEVKSAPYPFTTLEPNLSYLPLEDGSRIYIADLPGIIAGANQNKGLGIEFLRHIERTKAIVFMLDASGIDGRTPTDDFAVLREELRGYNAAMLETPFVVVLNKMDEPQAAELAQEFCDKHPELKDQTYRLSALTGEGLDPLIASFQSLLKAYNDELAKTAAATAAAEAASLEACCSVSSDACVLV